MPTATPLLLLPGTLCNGRLFAPMLDALGDPPAVIGDMTGARNAPALAQRLLRQAPPVFSLLGFSLGGIVAMEMIAQAQDRIERLALISTTPRPDPPANAFARRHALRRARENGIDSYTDENWPLFVSPARRGDVALKGLIGQMARETGLDGFADQTEVAINRADSRPRLASVRVPTLVLAGQHEQVCPLDAHREIADAIDGAVFATVDAGHFAPLEQPDAVASHVRDWLARSPDRLAEPQRSRS
ncbi:MAG: alpha/beta fold hydrolase [Rhizobiaceae bacterium]